MNCPNCNNSDTEDLQPYSGLHAPFTRLSLFKCTGCELVFAAPIPTTDELGKYYSNYWDGSVAISTPSTRRYYIAQSLSRIRYLRDKINLPEKMEVLDIGAGLGLFHKAMVDEGINHEFTAIEFDAKQLEQLNKSDIKECYKELSDLPADRKYDLVILSHVLEHMSSPHQFISDIMIHVKPGGYLFVELPNSDYRYKAIYESHLLFFTPASLRNMLGHHGKVVDVSTVGQQAAKLNITSATPQSGPILLIKEIIKTMLVLVTPDHTNKQIKRFKMSDYGGDRQWLRAIITTTEK